MEQVFHIAYMAKSNKQIREGLRKWLVESTSCSIQEGIDGKGYPCGTCFMDLLNRIGLDEDNPMYHESNDEPTRHNEVWRAILQIRDAKI